MLEYMVGSEIGGTTARVSKTKSFDAFVELAKKGYIRRQSRSMSHEYVIEITSQGYKVVEVGNRVIKELSLQDTRA